jgi:hypothetical protein
VNNKQLVSYLIQKGDGIESDQFFKTETEKKINEKTETKRKRE